MALSYYILDSETCGLKCGWHEVNQVSIIRVTDKFQKTINIKVDYPERADSRALEIQGKTRYDLKKGIHRSEAIVEIEEFIAEDGFAPNARVVAAHNASFDSRFINQMWITDNKKFPIEMWLCTVALTRKLAKRQGLVKPKVNLKAALAIAGVQEKLGAHNAAVDVFNTLALFEALMKHDLDHLSLIKTSEAKKKVNTNDEQYEDFE